jgi:oxazoline/thiazoline synthase
MAEHDMDFYNDVFRWHQRFLPCVLEERLLLLEERETLMFAAPEALQLQAVLSQQASLQTLVEQQGWSGPLPSVLYMLEEFTRRQLIQPRHGASRDYLMPDMAAVPRHIGLTPRVEALNLSTGVTDAALAELARDLEAGLGVGSPSALTLVCCDDLVDPRLAAIEQRQRALGRAWLLCKATGIQAAVGPVFDPARSNSACWHCLAQRVLWNRPIAAWWLAQRAELPCVPIAAEPARILRRLVQLPALARSLVCEPGYATQRMLTQSILTWSGEEEPAVHAVVRRPQCAACGDPQYLQRQQRQPISITRCAKLPEGSGSRSVSAEVSLQRLQPHLSALCGVIAQLEPVAGNVYRSAFFKQVRGEASPASALTQLCLGKGASAAWAQVSALGEALERYAAQYQGDEACIEASAADLDAPCILPQQLLEHARTATRWAPAWSLTHAARRYLPFEYCYANTPWQQVHPAAWTSNGCAAGNTLEEAILQGLLEVVERDAAAIWWYNRIQRPAFAWQSLPQRCREYAAAALPPQWEAWVLDLTHDLGIPVAAAVAHHAQQGWALGFGCSLDASHACERALTELVQLIAVKRSVTVAEENSGTAPAFLLPESRNHAVPAPVSASDDVALEIEACVRSVARQGLECVILNYSRPDLPLCTVKVVVPGLCHIWPGRFSERLRQVPVALRWRANAAATADLNPQPLYL